MRENWRTEVASSLPLEPTLRVPLPVTSPSDADPPNALRVPLFTVAGAMSVPLLRR
jgi:hypothetical protein